MHLNGFRNPAASSSPAGLSYHLTVCIWPRRHFLWYGTGCAGICVCAQAAVTADRNDKQRGFFGRLVCLFVFSFLFCFVERQRLARSLTVVSFPIHIHQWTWSPELCIQLVACIVPMQTYNTQHISSERRGRSQKTCWVSCLLLKILWNRDLKKVSVTQNLPVFFPATFTDHNKSLLLLSKIWLPKG